MQGISNHGYSCNYCLYLEPEGKRPYLAVPLQYMRTCRISHIFTDLREIRLSTSTTIDFLVLSTFKFPKWRPICVGLRRYGMTDIFPDIMHIVIIVITSLLRIFGAQG